MKRLRKLIVGGIALLLILILLAGGGGVLAVNSLVRKGVEKGATYALGVNTSLGSARVGLLSGELDLKRLKVDNPAGFQSPHFLALGDGGLAVTLPSLLKETIEVPRFKLDALDVHLERKAGASNYQVILDNLGRLAGPSQPGQPGPAGQEKRFVVRDLAITSVTIHVDLLGIEGATAAIGDATGARANVTIPIQEIRLTDVGRTGSGVPGTGVTIRELASIVVQAILAAAVENGGGILPDDVARDLVGRLADLGDLRNLGMQVGGRALQNVQGIAQSLGKSVGGKLGADAGKAIEDAAGKAIEGAAKGLEGILGGGKKEDRKK